MDVGEDDGLHHPDGDAPARGRNAHEWRLVRPVECLAGCHPITLRHHILDAHAAIRERRPELQRKLFDAVQRRGIPGRSRVVDEAGGRDFVDEPIGALLEVGYGISRIQVHHVDQVVPYSLHLVVSELSSADIEAAIHLPRVRRYDLAAEP